MLEKPSNVALVYDNGGFTEDRYTVVVECSSSNLLIIKTNEDTSIFNVDKDSNSVSDIAVIIEFSGRMDDLISWYSLPDRLKCHVTELLEKVD